MIRIDMEQASSWSLPPISIVRNGSFQNLGFLSNPYPVMLTFVESARFARDLKESVDVACVIVTEDLANHIPSNLGLAISSNPRRSFLEIHNYLAAETSFYWSDFETRIDPTARIHPRALVPPMNVVIGANAVIEANVTIAERTMIGDRCFIHAGVVIGSEGFQTVRSATEVLEMVHAGGVKIDAGARILANTVVARSVFRQMTSIGTDSRIGNMVFISHNCTVGRRASVGHGATINGGVRIGEDASIGPGATLATGITIGAGARVSIGSTVVRDVAANESVTGMGALETRKMFRAQKEIDRRK